MGPRTRLKRARARGRVEPRLFLPRRLDKYLRDTTLFSAARAREALAAGRVCVAGPGALDDERLVPERLVFEDDVVTVDGARVEPLRRHHHAMLNKPRGVTSSTADPLGSRDLSLYLREMPRGSFPVGRLDRETTGLLLFTTDGDLATAILQPDHATSKQYWLWLDDCVTDDDPRLRSLVEGIALPCGVARASEVRVLARSEACTEVLLTLRQGMNRQIRRMCDALGLHLVHLHRKSVGSLTLDALPLGSWRALGDDEIEALWTAAGGRHLVLQRQLTALAATAREARADGRPRRHLERWLEQHAKTAVPTAAVPAATASPG